MKVHVISSSSAGNAYIVEDHKGFSLMIEAGKRTFVGALVELHDIEQLSGLVISHSHSDHIGEANSWIPYTTVYRPNFQNGVQFETPDGAFSIIPILANHDGVTCYNFFIRSNNDGQVLFFATDCYSYAHVIGAMLVDIALIECNHSTEVLMAGTYPKELKERVSRAHCNVERCAEGIAQSKCTRFVLIHPSDHNLNEEAALEYLRGRFPNRDIQFAKPGLKVEI